MAVTVKLDSDGIADLLQSAGVREELRTRAERVLSAARSAAPIDSGDYRESLHIVEETHTDRDVVKVVAEIRYGAAVEAATGNLARALDSA